MTARAQMMSMMELVPDTEIPILLEVVKRFIPIEDADDIATADDIAACIKAEEEFKRGDVIPLERFL